jgi:hypothetical protein
MEKANKNQLGNSLCMPTGTPPVYARIPDWSNDTKTKNMNGL